MLYGHIDRPKHRIDHLVRLRELQDETGGFQTFIPLAFHPDNSRMAEIPKPSGVMDLKIMAISRLMLDNFPHIKAYWVMLGHQDRPGRPLLRGRRHRRHRRPREDLPRGRRRDPAGITVAEIRRLITEAGRVPVERDTLYHRVERRTAHGPPGTHRRQGWHSPRGRELIVRGIKSCPAPAGCRD